MYVREETLAERNSRVLQAFGWNLRKLTLQKLLKFDIRGGLFLKRSDPSSQRVSQGGMQIH